MKQLMKQTLSALGKSLSKAWLCSHYDNSRSHNCSSWSHSCSSSSTPPTTTIKVSPLFPSSATYIMPSGTATCQPVFGTGLLGGTAVTKTATWLHILVMWPGPNDRTSVVLVSHLDMGIIRAYISWGRLIFMSESMWSTASAKWETRRAELVCSLLKIWKVVIRLGLNPRQFIYGVHIPNH